MAPDYTDDDDDDGGSLDTVGRQVMSAVSRVYDLSPALTGDPSQLAWPPTLVIEIALKLDTPRAICESHNISRDEWDAIRTNPHFVAELGRAVEALRNDGMAFKARSQLQALELLKQSWKMIHDAATPANVKADLIKSTIRWSGLDASKDAALGAKTGQGFSIQINLL